MEETFEIITFLCYGKDNAMIDELRKNVKQSLVYDPTNDAWYLGEWVSDE